MAARMLLLRLPSTLRATLALRFYRPTGLSINDNSNLLPRNAGRGKHFASRDIQFPKSYATLVSDSTQRLWSEHGKPVPSNTERSKKLNGKVAHPEENPSAVREVTLSPKSAAPSEKDEILKVLTKRARSKHSSRRRLFRQRIHDALHSTEPIAALKRILHQAEPVAGRQVQQASVSATDEKVAISNEAEPQMVQILDVDYIQRTQPLPKRDEYPQALENLFNPIAVSNAIHNACSKLKISMQSEVDFTSKDVSRADLKRLHPSLLNLPICTLNVDIPNVFQGHANGEGFSKQTAKQAAWLQLVSKMHVEGALRELFPAPNELPKAVKGEADIFETHLEPANVDQNTMEQEKDAKCEIYNYAASLGTVPHFEAKLVKSRTPRARRGQIAKKLKAVFHFRIRLEGIGIDVTAAGQDSKTAEIAAAVAFKGQAEKRHLDTGGETVGSTPLPYSALSVETAGQFFEFYKAKFKGLNLEIEHENIPDSGQGQNVAKLTIDDKHVGQTAVMRTKKDAESVAYLSAAVEITREQPHLLQDFQNTLTAGKGKVLPTMSSIDLQIHNNAIRSMREALVEARSAGLPDDSQALSAETNISPQSYLRRSKPLTLRELEAANNFLARKKDDFDNNPELQALRTTKSKLPMSMFRDELLTMISENIYSIVVGATGSGKTTQVPQILFEDAVSHTKGASCNIICTQPRRIAATSVAQRVAVERNEKLRLTVGYQVRFDAKLPYNPYGITYCTTGILLEKLKHDPDDVLDSASHIIVDEVHERDLNIDFLMIVLKRAVQVRTATGKRVPKVVLMSATLDVNLFEQYFRQEVDGKTRPCPSLSVPGRTFPVKEKYLGDVMHDLFQARGKEVVKALLDEEIQTRDYLDVEVRFSKSESIDQSQDKGSIIDWKRERRPQMASDEGEGVIAEKEEALVPVQLLVATVAHICDTTDDGAMLAFLPGLEEILRAQKQLLEMRPFGIDFKDKSKFQIHLMHSTVPHEQQAEIFNPSPPGCRKIILSTNIAETSVTVPEVKYVVDTGKLREKRYDQLRRITRLQCVWASKSNSKQRAGRAGRVQDGYYYALFSQERHNALRAVGLPELLRSDLQTTCLDIKSQKFEDSVASFLAQAIEFPTTRAVNAAVQNLIAIEAFTVDEKLTSLGRLLSQLPVHPTLGKMITLGVLFQCLDPMIILSAASEERALFVTPIGARAEATRAHQSYVGDSSSDHIAFLKAFDELRLLRDKYGMDAVWQRARENYLHVGAFRVISQTAKQIETILQEAGLIGHNLTESSQCGPPELNGNANNHDLIKSLLLAGVHPHLAAKTTSNGFIYRTPSESSVIQHPSSLNAEMKSKFRHPYGALFAYSDLSRSNDGRSLFVRNTSQVTPLMAALFGGKLQMTENGRLEMDEWLPFFVKSHDRQFATKLILEFRKALDRVLNGAFHSLSELRAGSERSFASDPLREKFAQRVVDVLDHASPSAQSGPRAFQYQ